MNVLTTLPTDAFVTAAFAELLSDVDGFLAVATDKEEKAFWRRQFNALNKAQAYWLQGVRPQIAPDAYLLASASRPGALVHRLARLGGIVVCSCEAGQKQTLCWHHMLVNVLERAAELESLAAASDDPPGENPMGDEEGDELPEAAAEPWRIGAVMRRHILQARLDATAAYLETLRAALPVEAAPPRPLRVRLVETKKRSPYFVSAVYLSKAA